MIVVIFGVAGVGKTTLGKLLAKNFGWRFYDADDFHSASNIEKMGRGVPLTDEDRQPWLQQLRSLIERSLEVNENAVLACSALKRKYRDELRAGPDVKFVFLHAGRERVAEQLRNRHGHFFDPKLLDVQFADLEEPESEEDTIAIEVKGKPEELVREIGQKLRVEG